MQRNRLEAFSDGVLAIIITIMALELRVPHGARMADLHPLLPVFISYVLSFLNIGIYWNNHHHLLQGVRRVNGPILWTNIHLLFWLSLLPFMTGWMGENRFAPLPVALYGVVLFMAGFAYYILTRTIIRYHGADSLLAKAVGIDYKAIASITLYVVAIPTAFLASSVSLGIYAAVAIMWVIPDRRIERSIGEGGAE